MGIRGHVQIQHPKYGKVGVTAWIDTAIEKFLCKHDVALTILDSNEWEIVIDDNLYKAKKILDTNPQDFDIFLPADMRGKGYGGDVSNLIAEGLEAARKRNYSTINIDWW